MNLRSTFLGSKLRIVGTGLLAVVGVLVAAYFLGVIGVPELVGVENSFGTVNQTTTEVHSRIALDNPNPVAISLGGVSVGYAVDMNGVEMATGEKHGIHVGTGRSNVSLLTHMDNTRIPTWWVSHVRNDESTSVDVTATVTSSTLGRSVSLDRHLTDVETDLLSAFNSTETRPVDAGVALVDDPVLYVNETSADWGTVTDAETDVSMRFVVYNPKSYPLAVSELGYDVTMGGVDVGEGATEQPDPIEPKTTETIDATVTIDNSELDDWWVSHLQSGQVSELRIDFYAQVGLQGQTIQVPLDDFSHVQEIRTDIFGGGGEPAAGDGDADGTATGTTDDGPLGTETGDGLVGTTDGGLLGDTTSETTDDTTSETTSEETTTSEATTDDGGLLAVARPAT